MPNFEFMRDLTTLRTTLKYMNIYESSIIKS